MGIGKFFRALLGFDEPHSNPEAEAYLEQTQQLKRGKLAASRRRLSVITKSHEIALHLSTNLKPVIEQAGFAYDDHPTSNSAVGSQIIVLDVRPKADAQMHGKYDQIIRMKKSMGKVHDVLCMFGLRESYKKYPRGTYASLVYFCINEKDLNAREADLTEKGLQTIEGPTLYNFADMSAVIVKLIDRLTNTGMKSGEK